MDEHGDAEEEEHEQHSSVLEIIQVIGIESAIDSEFQMRGVEKLDAHIRERPDQKNVKLQVPGFPGEAASGVPCASTKRSGVHDVVRDGVQ